MKRNKSKKNTRYSNLTNNKKAIIWSIVFLLLIFLYYYLFLPALNFKSPGFYLLLAILAGFVVGIVKFVVEPKNKEERTYKTIRLEKSTGQLRFDSITYESYHKLGRLSFIGLVFSLLVYCALMILFSIVGSKLFQAKNYYSQLEIKEGTQEELETIFNFDNGDVLLPIIDKDLAFKLAQASLGDYGAQYTIDYDNFTLISVHRNGVDELVRIAPLEYSNLFVSLARYNQGTIGYIEVNVVTKKTTLVTFEDGLKYMPSGYFARDLDRHIRFKYLSALYSTKNFEIDDDGNPYWVIPTYTNKIGIINGPMPTGTIIVDPITGNTNRYRLGEEPSWVDRVVHDEIVEKQATNALRYKNGFFNVHFGQKKEVFQLSDGYNYFIKGGQTYYVSCITSPNESDQTSIGFVTINLKTKEAHRYSIKGITEMRAREIAMNDARVKAQALDATWPILIDYQGVATYFLVLKNDVQAQKIVFINVSTGEMIAMGDNINEAKAEYDRLLAESGSSNANELDYSGTITNIRDLGSTIEFMISGVGNKYFVCSPSLSLDARFMKLGDSVTIKCKDYDTYYFVTSYTKN